MAGVVTGVAWYRRNEWPLLVGLASDADQLQHTYEEWRLQAERTRARLESQGTQVQKIDIALADLVAWCTQERRLLNEEARSAFLAHKLRASQTPP